MSFDVQMALGRIWTLFIFDSLTNTYLSPHKTMNQWMAHSQSTTSFTNHVSACLASANDVMEG